MRIRWLFLSFFFPLAVPLVAHGAGVNLYRIAQRNSMFRCSGTLYESLAEAGNAHEASGVFLLACLNSPTQVRWLMTTSYGCELQPFGVRDHSIPSCSTPKAVKVNYSNSYNYDIISYSRKPLKHFYKLYDLTMAEYCNYKNLSGLAENNQSKDKANSGYFQCGKVYPIKEARLTTESDHSFLMWFDFIKKFPRFQVFDDINWWDVRN